MTGFRADFIIFGGNRHQVAATPVFHLSSF
jgi:hypothetical protein